MTILFSSAGTGRRCGLSDARHLTAHIQCSSRAPYELWGGWVICGSVAGAAPASGPEVAVASLVADALAMCVAPVLVGAAEALGAFDGGLSLGADGVLGISVAQRCGAAGELVPWCSFLEVSPGGSRGRLRGERVNGPLTFPGLGEAGDAMPTAPSRQSHSHER